MEKKEDYLIIFISIAAFLIGLVIIQNYREEDHNKTVISGIVERAYIRNGNLIIVLKRNISDTIIIYDYRKNNEEEIPKKGSKINISVIDNKRLIIGEKFLNDIMVLHKVQ